MVVFAASPHCGPMPWQLPLAIVAIVYSCRLIDKSCSSFPAAVIAVVTYAASSALLLHLFCLLQLDLVEPP